MSPKGVDEQQPRLFDEHNDDNDDDVGYRSFTGKNDGLRVVLVAPDRSPAMPTAAMDRCCGRATSAAAAAENEAVATDDGPNSQADKRPVPVLVGGLGETVARWKTSGDSEDIEVNQAWRSATAAADKTRDGVDIGRRPSSTKVGGSVCS